MILKVLKQLTFLARRDWQCVQKEGFVAAVAVFRLGICHVGTKGSVWLGCGQNSRLDTGPSYIYPVPRNARDQASFSGAEGPTDGAARDRGSRCFK